MHEADQGTPSRAYASTCSFSKSSEPPLSEKKAADYFKDRQKKLDEMNAEGTVRD